MMSATKRAMNEERVGRNLRTPRTKPKARNEGSMLGKDEFFEKKDVLSHIMGFLDVKSLYKFALTCKTSLELLQTEDVVRSALFHGGHPKTNMDRLMALASSGKIMVPSPLRMLRLCIGKLCEHCQSKRVNLVSKQFGVFVCKDCMEKSGFVKTIRRFDCSYYPLVSHMYTIPEGSHRLRIWAKPFTDYLGDRCGPIMSLECRLRKGEAHKEALAAIRAKDAKNRLSHLPKMEKTYKENSKSANDQVLALRLQRRLASEAAQSKRNERICAMVSSLSDELGDVSWKSVLLSYEMVAIQQGNQQRNRIFFQAPLAKDILEDFVAAPSKITRTRIKQTAYQIQRYMQMFEASHLHDFLCFSQDPRFRNHCLEMFPSYSLLHCDWVNLHSLNVLNRLYYHDRTSIIAHFISHQMSTDEDRSEVIHPEVHVFA